MRTRKLIGLVIAVALMICAFTAISAANAQECAWDLYVDGVKYSSTADYAKNGSLTYNGSMVTLNNFSGKSIAAIPGGTYGDDDAPYLVIQVKGTNTLTGDYISQDSVSGKKPTSGTYWKGALYAQPRQGGSGENSRIRILGTGTLNIDIRSTTAQRGVNQKAVVCDNFDVAGDATVSIKYGGNAITDSKIYAVDAYETNVRTNYGTSSNSILDIKATASPYIDTRTQAITVSNCEVYGVTGTVNVETTNYFSIDNYTLTTGKTGYTCKNALVQAGSAAYFKTSAANGRYADIMLNVNSTLLKSEFTDSKVGYLACTPKTPNAKSSLKPIDWSKVNENAPYPKYGDAKPSAYAFKDLTSSANCYLKLSAKVLPYGYGAGESESFDKFADKPFSFYHEVVPAKGYYVSQTAPSASGLKYYTTYPISISNNTLKLIYSYSKPTEKLNRTVICSTHKNGNSSIKVNAGGEDKQCTYNWKYTKYLDGGSIYGNDIETTGSPYGQAIDGIYKYQLTIRGDFMDYCFYDDEDAQELCGIGLYCEIVSMPSGAKSETEECYYSWGHDLAYKVDGLQHVKVCNDPECNYVLESTRAAHRDTNKDGKCDLCRKAGLPVITKQPAAITVDARDAVSYSVTATGTDLTYKWYRERPDGTKTVVSSTDGSVSGQNTAQLTFDPKKVEGYYGNCGLNNSKFFCVIASANGSVESERALLTVTHKINYNASYTWDETTHKYSCYCGEKIEGNHKFDAGVVSKAATCVEAGEKKYTCTECSYFKKEVIPVTDHTSDKGAITKAATCTATGTKTYKCTTCDKVLKTETIKATGHKEVALKARTATAKKSGLTAGKKCSVCGNVLVAQKMTLAQTTGLKASTVKTTSIKLKWTKIDGAKYYKVEQSTDGKKWKTVKTVDTNSITVSKLTAGKKYQFRVTALDSSKKISGKASTVLKTGTLTAAPAITVKSTKSKTAVATWKKVTGASKYTVYKSTDGKKWTKVTTTTKLTYTLTKLTGGKKIYVKVVAVNAYSKNSAASAVKNVTVKK